MRIAILSDIHSNLEALNIALKDIEAKKPDVVVCLGDIIGYGANPNECIDLVRAHCDIVLLGNHDAALFDPSLVVFFNPLARTALQWTLRTLTPENVAFLRSLRLTTELHNILFVHASPTRPAAWEYIVDQTDAQRHFPSFHQQLCFVGHSHIPGIYSVEGKEAMLLQGKRYIINVGSIGQPRDRDPRLSYGLFDVEEWNYGLVRLEYSVSTAAQKILDAGLPSALAYRLFEGR